MAEEEYSGHNALKQIHLSSWHISVQFIAAAPTRRRSLS